MLQLLRQERRPRLGSAFTCRLRCVAVPGGFGPARSQLNDLLDGTTFPHEWEIIDVSHQSKRSIADLLSMAKLRSPLASCTTASS